MTDYRFFPRDPASRIVSSEEYRKYVVSRLTPRGRASMDESIRNMMVSSRYEEDGDEEYEEVEYESVSYKNKS